MPYQSRKTQYSASWVWYFCFLSTEILSDSMKISPSRDTAKVGISFGLPKFFLIFCMFYCFFSGNLQKLVFLYMSIQKESMHSNAQALVFLYVCETNFTDTFITFYLFLENIENLTHKRGKYGFICFD